MPDISILRGHIPGSTCDDFQCLTLSGWKWFYSCMVPTTYEPYYTSCIEFLYLGNVVASPFFKELHH